MSERLTKTQITAMGEISRSISGRLIFGSGFGRYNVALRALLMRPTALVHRQVISDVEHWSLTGAGLAALLRSIEGGERG